MRKYVLAALIVTVEIACLTLPTAAHPGSGIVVDEKGQVLVADINRGLLKVAPNGTFTNIQKVAGHWLTLDMTGGFARMDFEKSDHWPRWFKRRSPRGAIPALLSDGGSPLVVHRDGNLYYVCTDEKMVPGGLQIGRLSPDGKLALVAPNLKQTVDSLGGIKGLASGPGDSLYATCPGALLEIKLDGTFSIIKHPIKVADCQKDLPPNTPSSYEPFLTGLAVDPNGTVYLAATGCRCVLKVTPAGEITTFIKSEAPWSPTAIALHGGDIYVLEWTNAMSDGHEYRPQVRKRTPDGKLSVLATVEETPRK